MLRVNRFPKALVAKRRVPSVACAALMVGASLMATGCQTTSVSGDGAQAAVSAPSLKPMLTPTNASFAAESLGRAAPTEMAAWAASYVEFRKDLEAIDAMPVRSMKETREAHQRLGSHDAASLARGWMAYAALVAADTPEFVDGLRSRLRKSKREKVLTALSTEPRYASSIPGAQAAMQSVLASASRDSARIASLGEKFRQRAYDLQKSDWATRPAAGQQERIAQARAQAKARQAQAAPLNVAASRGVISPLLASAGHSWSAAWAEAELDAPAAYAMSGPRAQPMMDQILSLAVRYSLGATEGQYSEIAAALTKNDRGKQCFNWARLHLDQCIAATRAPYEEAYCIGRHALDDVSECVGWIAADTGAQG